MDKKVSIIIPVYNIEKYIGRCLDSILNQTYKNLEVICVNDGSTDNSLNILKEYKNNDDRISIIDKKNEGVSAARNDAIDVATGDYMMFVDGDDWIEVEMIANLIDEINLNDADIVRSFYLRDYVYKQEVESMNLGTDKMVISENEKAEKIYPLFINGYVINSMWGQIIKSDIIRDNNIRIDRSYIYGEDAKFNYELYTHAKKIVLIDKPYYHYFFNDNSATTIKNIDKITKRFENILRVHNELYDFAIKWGISTDNINSNIANRIIREFIKRSREYFVLIDQGLSKKTIKESINTFLQSDIVKKSIKLNGYRKIEGLNKEGEMYGKFILKGDLDSYVTLGIYIYKLKSFIKKITKK